MTTANTETERLVTGKLETEKVETEMVKRFDVMASSLQPFAAVPLTLYLGGDAGNVFRADDSAYRATFNRDSPWP
jgi:hypothetical protein